MATRPLDAPIAPPIAADTTARAPAHASPSPAVTTTSQRTASHAAQVTVTRRPPSSPSSSRSYAEAAAPVAPNDSAVVRSVQPFRLTLDNGKLFANRLARARAMLPTQARRASPRPLSIEPFCFSNMLRCAVDVVRRAIITATCEDACFVRFVYWKPNG